MQVKGPGGSSTRAHARQFRDISPPLPQPAALRRLRRAARRDATGRLVRVGQATLDAEQWFADDRCFHPDLPDEQRGATLRSALARSGAVVAALEDALAVHVRAVALLAELAARGRRPEVPRPFRLSPLEVAPQSRPPPVLLVSTLTASPLAPPLAG